MPLRSYPPLFQPTRLAFAHQLFTTSAVRRNHYETLQISANATPADVKKLEPFQLGQMKQWLTDQILLRPL
jgi:hypothetical protein